MSVPVDPIKLQLDALIDGWHADGLGRGQLIRNGDTYELYCDGEWLAAGRLPDLWEYASQLDSRARAQTPEETDPYDVPLLVARGCSSETYLYDAAQAIAAKNKAAYIYHFGDHDPTGQVAAAHIERMLRSFAPDADIYFKSVAVTKEQITDWKLPTRPTKRDGNTHARNFTGDSCELDSIPPLKLRALVRECIEQHIDRELFAKLKAAEKSEREALTMFAKQWRAA